MPTFIARLKMLFSNEFWEEHTKRSNQIAYLYQEVRELKELNRKEG